MKKTLVALAVLAAAGSAQAIELYNQDKVTVNFTGDVQIQYFKGLTDGDEFKQQITDADFGFDTRYAVNDEFAVGAYWEFAGGDADDVTDPKAGVGDVYMGLYSANFGSVKIGKTATVLDDAGIGKDYEFGSSAFFSQGSPFAGPEVVRYDLDKGMFYGAVAVQQDKNGLNGLGEDGSYYDGKIGARFADVDVSAFLATSEIRPNGGTEFDENFWAVQAVYTGVENLELAAGYYDAKLEEKATSDEVKLTSIQLAAAYTWEKVTFAAGWGQTEAKDAIDGKESTAYGNVAYSFAPSTSAFFEVGHTDAENSQLGMVVGLSANF
jgi:predicted porin